MNIPLYQWLSLFLFLLVLATLLVLYIFFPAVWQHITSYSGVGNPFTHPP